MALAIATVANSIAALSVSGVTIKDVDEIPSAVDTRQPTILPKPDFVTGFVMERDSFGAGSAKMTVRYVLNYRFCYKPVGAGRAGQIEHYDGMVDKVALFWDAVLAINTLTGAVDIEPAGVAHMGLVNDPADNIFLGCDLAVNVTEFVN
jgi:hypothetical protein